MIRNRRVSTCKEVAEELSRLLHHNVHFDIKIGQNDIDMITKSNN